MEYIYEDVPINFIKKEIIFKLLNNYYSILSIKDNNDNNIIYLIQTCLKSINKFIPFIEIIINDNNSKLIFLI